MPKSTLLNPVTRIRGEIRRIRIAPPPLKVLAIALCTGLLAQAADPAKQLTLEIRDYLTMPDPGKRDVNNQINSVYSRINFLRQEPGPDRGRYFINEQNGRLYIVVLENSVCE